MKKFAAILLYLLFFILMPLPASDPANLLQNTDFSQPPVGNTAPGWDHFDGANVVVEGGQKILRLVKMNQSKVMVQQVAPLPAGSKTVKLTAKVRQGDLPGASYEICFHALDANKKPLTPAGQPGNLATVAEMLGHPTGKPTKSWKTLTLHAKVPPNAAYVSVILFAGIDNGTVDFSELRCEAAK